MSKLNAYAITVNDALGTLDCVHCRKRGFLTRRARNGRNPELRMIEISDFEWAHRTCVIGGASSPAVLQATRQFMLMEFRNGPF